MKKSWGIVPLTYEVWANSRYYQNQTELVPRGEELVHVRKQCNVGQNQLSKNTLPYDPAIPFISIYSRELNTLDRQMFTETLL